MIGKLQKKQRYLFILGALMLIGGGLVSILLKGELFYSNWRGAKVFAPLSVITGLLLLYLGVFKPEKLDDKPKKKEKKRG